MEHSLRRRLTDPFRKRDSDNPWLDLLRSLAIILVVLRHGQRVVDAGPDLGPLELLALNGWVGVDLFFVLSGYLVTGGLLARGATLSRGDILHYAGKRVMRIVPAYVAVLLLVLVGYFPGFIVVQDDLALRTLYHLVFLQDVLPSDINVVFWSLAVEIKFYAAVPFILLALHRCRTMTGALTLILSLAALAIVARAAIFAGLSAPDYQTFWAQLRSPFYACLEPLMLGLMIAFLERAGALRLTVRQGMALMTGAALALALWLGSSDFMAQITGWDATAQPALIAILFAAMVAGGVQLRTLPLPLEPVFRVISRISYALYLVHFPLIPLSRQLSTDLAAGPAGFWVIYVGLGVVHALVILIFIEHPMMTRKPRAVVERAQA